MTWTQWGLRAAGGDLKHLPTIRSRLVLLAMACVIPASLMAAGLIAYDNHNERKALAQSSLNTARSIMSAVDRDMAGVQAAMLALASSGNLTSNNLAAFDEQAHEVLKTLKANNIFLIDPAFKQRVNTLRRYPTEMPIVTSPQLREIFKTGLPTTTDLYFGKVSLTPIISTAVPVVRNGATVYVLGAGLLPSRLSGLLAKQHLSPDWIAAIFDSTGTIVARTHHMERFVGSKGSPAVIARMGDVSEDSIEVVSVEGIPMLSIFSRSSISNWTVAIGIPTSVLNQGLWKTLAWLIVGLLLLLAFSLTLAWAIGTRIAASIQQLAAPALALGSGIDVVVPPLHLREADEVGRALNRASTMLMASQHKASHDPLTGLANRALFEDILGHQLAISHRTRSNLTIVCIDLDGFKPVNDMHGHAAGDEVLCEVARRLKAAVRESDLAARLGGDEFALILINASMASSRGVAEKLIDALSAPYTVGMIDLDLSASIGIATYPDSGTTPGELTERADEAMYQAKALGRRRYCASPPYAGNGRAPLTA